MPQHGPEIPVAQHIIRDHGIILTSALARRFRRHGVGWRSRRPARPGAAHGRIGSMLRWLTAGESHGRALVAICEGMPAGVEITTADVGAALARRRAGYGRGARMKFEQDEAEITAGVRHGRTLGGPVAMRIANTEWPKWETIMSPDPGDQAQPADLARLATRTWRACRNTVMTMPARCWSVPARGKPRRGSRWVSWRVASCGRYSAPRSLVTSFRSAR